MSNGRHIRGRLAPSPTGYLHLGNAWAFLLAWLNTRSAGGTVILRIEDIDPQRSKFEYTSAIIEDLHWLGLDWDEGPDIGGACAPYTQGLRSAIYQDVLRSLAARNLTYPCFCTRKELRTLAGAPHVGDIGAPYPGTCRKLTEEDCARLQSMGHRPTMRLQCNLGEHIVFSDMLYGLQDFTLQECGGDFALCRSDGVVSYQLAVSVDDALMGVTHVVRGNDILMSTPRQIYLAQLLGWSMPYYGHLPLLLDAEGERLAKRHQSLTLRALRQAGSTPMAIVGILAWLACLQEAPTPISPRELCKSFCWDALPKENIRLPVSLDSLLSNGS